MSSSVELVSSHLCSLRAFDFAVAHFGNVSFLFAIVAFSISEFAICWIVLCSTSVASYCVWRIGWGILLEFRLLAVASVSQLMNSGGGHIL